MRRGIRKGFAVCASFALMVFSASASASAQSAEEEPVADSKAVAVSGNTGFTLLGGRMVRMEWAADVNFEDSATLGVVNRRLPVPAYTVSNPGKKLTVKSSGFALKYLRNGKIDENNLYVTFRMADPAARKGFKTVAWRPGMEDSGNLPGTKGTLDDCDDVRTKEPYDKGVASRGGWAVIDESDSQVFVSVDSDWKHWGADRDFTGVFTPIFRTHSTKDWTMEKRFMVFPDHFDAIRAAFRLEYAISENPYYIKPGAVIPMASDKIKSLRGKDNPLKLNAAPADGESTVSVYDDDGATQAYSTEYVTTQVRKVSDANSVRIIVASHQGNYRRIDPRHCVQVVLSGAFAPEKATVNGAGVPYSRFASHNAEVSRKDAEWGYVGADLSAVIYLPETLAPEELVIESSLNEYSASHFDLLNGKKGLMRRLMDITPENRLLFVKDVHAYMMLPDPLLALAQCASFINEEPRNTGKYLEEIDTASLTADFANYEKISSDFIAKIKARVSVIVSTASMNIGGHSPYNVKLVCFVGNCLLAIENVKNMENDNRKLYPIRFVDEGADVSWGRVSYQIADLGFKDSMIDNGWFGGNTLSELMGTYLERVVGDDVFEFYGLQFPVMVKVMDVTGWQPLQMNAADDVAAERYDSFGKTALWYVQDAAKGAELVLGFSRDIDPSEFYKRCQDGTVKEVLNIVKPHKGEAYLIKPGTVFAAGPGLKIVEIAESSELVFNLHNWELESLNTEELMLDEAFDMIDFKKYVPEPVTGDKLAVCPEFVVTKLDLKDGLHIFSDQPGSFAVYYCASGEATVKVPVENTNDKGTESVESYPLKSGHSILVPSELNDFFLIPDAHGTVLLETLVEKRLVKDSYTDQEVEPSSSVETWTPDPHIREWNS